MTSPLNREELRKELSDIAEYNWGRDTREKRDAETIDEMLNFIDQYAQQVAIEARIDEQNFHLRKLKSGNWRSYATEVSDRIAELEKERKQ